MSLAALGASTHLVGEGGIVLVAFFLPFAILAVVLEIPGDTVGPAVGDGSSDGIVSLGNEGLVKVSGGARIGGRTFIQY